MMIIVYYYAEYPVFILENVQCTWKIYSLIVLVMNKQTKSICPSSVCSKTPSIWFSFWVMNFIELLNVYG